MSTLVAYVIPAADGRTRERHAASLRTALNLGLAVRLESDFGDRLNQYQYRHGVGVAGKSLVGGRWGYRWKYLVVWFHTLAPNDPEAEQTRKHGKTAGAEDVIYCFLTRARGFPDDAHPAPYVARFLGFRIAIPPSVPTS